VVAPALYVSIASWIDRREGGRRGTVAVVTDAQKEGVPAPRGEAA
jgi:hypothetical protein